MPTPDWYTNKPCVDLSTYNWTCPACQSANPEDEQWAKLASRVICCRCGEIFKVKKTAIALQELDKINANHEQDPA